MIAYQTFRTSLQGNWTQKGVFQDMEALRQMAQRHCQHTAAESFYVPPLPCYNRGECSSRTGAARAQKSAIQV